jgi:hypothetical protein
MYRLSTDSDGEQVAHIGVMIPYTGHVYELVGPASSLTSSDLKKFTAWIDVDGSCPSAHTLSQTLAELSVAYAADSSKQQQSQQRLDDGEERKRSRRTGDSLPSVMVVSMSIATADLDSITSTLQLAQEVAGNGAYYETVSYDTDACSVSTFYLPNNVPVLYVQNENKDAGKYTVADWEDDVTLTHADWETGTTTNNALAQQRNENLLYAPMIGTYTHLIGTGTG